MAPGHRTERRKCVFVLSSLSGQAKTRAVAWQFLRKGIVFAAVIFPTTYGIAYSWIAYKEIRPLHQAIPEDIDADADHFLWAEDANAAFSGGYKHQASDDELPYRARLDAIYLYSLVQAYRQAETGSSETMSFSHAGISVQDVIVSRPLVGAFANLFSALKRCRDAGLALPHRGVLELERMFAEMLEDTGAVQGLRASFEQWARISAALVQTVEGDGWQRFEAVRALQRGGQAAARLSREENIDQAQRTVYRDQAKLLLERAIELGLPLERATAEEAVLPKTTIRKWWWPLRWAIPEEASREVEIAPSGIITRLSSAPSCVSPPITRSIISSLSTLAGLAASTGDYATVQNFVETAQAFVRQQRSSLSPTSPSAQLQSHWLSAHDASLTSNLAELTARTSPTSALALLSSSITLATSTAHSLRTTFPTLLTSPTSTLTKLRSSPDPLEPLRLSLHKTLATAETTALNAHLLTGALHERQDDLAGALRSYNEAKRLAAGPGVPEEIALAEEKFRNAGMMVSKEMRPQGMAMKAGAAYGAQWRMANTCARRVKAKLAREEGREAERLREFAEAPKRLREREAMPRWVRRSAFAGQMLDIVDDQVEFVRDVARSVGL